MHPNCSKNIHVHLFTCSKTLIIPKRSIHSVPDWHLVKSATYQCVLAVGCLVLANLKLYYLSRFANQGGAWLCLLRKYKIGRKEVEKRTVIQDSSTSLRLYFYFSLDPDNNFCIGRSTAVQQQLLLIMTTLIREVKLDALMSRVQTIHNGHNDIVTCWLDFSESWSRSPSYKADYSRGKGCGNNSRWLDHNFKRSTILQIDYELEISIEQSDYEPDFSSSR